MTTDLLEYANRIRQCWTKETSELPNWWSPWNPSAGQCAVSAILLQEKFGGSIVRGQTPNGIIHYWNVINGFTVDITRNQFSPMVIIEPLQVDPPKSLYHSDWLEAKADVIRRQL